MTAQHLTELWISEVIGCYSVSALFPTLADPHYPAELNLVYLPRLEETICEFEPDPRTIPDEGQADLVCKRALSMRTILICHRQATVSASQTLDRVDRYRF